MDEVIDEVVNTDVEIIKWDNSSIDTMVYNYSKDKNKIVLNSYINVKSFQKAIVVYERKVLHVFKQGCYRLDRKLLYTIKEKNKLDINYKDLLKGSIFFVKANNYSGIAWNSDSSIMVRDKEYGPLSISAKGNYGFEVKDVEKFLNNFFVKGSKFKVSEISIYLKCIITNIIFGFMSQTKIAVFELSEQLEYLSKKGLEELNPKFEELGFSLTDFSISNISLPDWIGYINLDKYFNLSI